MNPQVAIANLFCTTRRLQKAPLGGGTVGAGDREAMNYAEMDLVGERVHLHGQLHIGVPPPYAHAKPPPVPHARAVHVSRGGDCLSRCGRCGAPASTRIATRCSLPYTHTIYVSHPAVLAPCRVVIVVAPPNLYSSVCIHPFLCIIS
ncbi:unnamed protein product [Sphagnum balticum]